jgi:hypothetical protein
MPAANDYRDSPTYWFALLEMARERGRFLEAQRALEQLRRLGVLVPFFRPGTDPDRRGGPHAA